MSQTDNIVRKRHALGGISLKGISLKGISLKGISNNRDALNLGQLGY